MFNNEDKYDDLIFKNAAAFNVPPTLIKAVIAKESSFNEKAIHYDKDENGKVFNVSYGLMQLSWNVAISLGFPGKPGTESFLMEPSTNIYYGVKLLSQIMRNYTDPKDIYAVYNSGKIRKNSYGEYTNSKGNTQVNTNVEKFYQYLLYFEKVMTPPNGGGEIPPQ